MNGFVRKRVKASWEIRFDGGRDARRKPAARAADTGLAIWRTGSGPAATRKHNVVPITAPRTYYLEPKIRFLGLFGAGNGPYRNVRVKKGDSERWDILTSAEAWWEISLTTKLSRREHAQRLSVRLECLASAKPMPIVRHWPHNTF